MKPDALLDYAVFQITPTRTRCELFISSKGENEKVASGLLQPFLAHLKTAEEQYAVGGYSFRLQPPVVEDVKAGWFTKATMQRFLRFVSTPEVLERVTAVETELIQLDEELSSYAEADDQHSMVSGGKYFTKYKSRRDSIPGDEPENDTAKGRLIKALETRYFQLQREQGMAFARAIAAGFDMDHLSDLLAFADCFGAARLSVACHKFAALCRKQQEGGLWLDEMEKVVAEGDNFSYQDPNTGITIAPAGLNPLTMPEARPAEESSLKEVEVDADRRGSDLRRQSSGYMDQHHHHPQMMGMPPSYQPWNFEQGYDPRYFPQGVVPVPVPYVNGGFPPMNPYWNVPPNGHTPSPTAAPADDDSDEEEVEKKGGKKNGRKSNSSRRKSAGLKRLSVGRGGKRSGMVVIRNINYITPTQDSAAKKNKNTEDESHGSSDFETGSEVDEHNGAVKKKSKSRPKQVPAGEVSSEGSRASTSGETKKDSTDEAFFTVPVRNSLHSGENGFSYDMESFPQHRSGTSSEALLDDSFALHGGGRANRVKGGTQYGLEDQMKSSNILSKDGVVLPQRSGGRSFGTTNHDSELSYRNPGRVDLNDSHIIPERTGVRDTTRSVEEPYQARKEEGHAKETSFEEFFIVPTRPVRETSEVTRRRFELDIPEAGQQLASVKEKPEKMEIPSFEPEMLPERTKEIGERRWNDVSYEMEIMAAIPSKPETEENKDEGSQEDPEFYEQYHEQRDAKLMKESGTKKSEREARMKSLQDSLDKRKAELSSRSKSTRSSILKTKKEKEEAERKRIEDLAAERRNRIAARSGASRTPAVSKSVSSIPKTRASPVPSTATRRSLTTSATKPPSRALSSTTMNKDGVGAKKPLPSRSTSTLSKSVASLSEVHKENAKPVGVRQQSSSTSTGSSTRKSVGTATPSVRRSVASVGGSKAG